MQKTKELKTVGGVTYTDSLANRTNRIKIINKTSLLP